MAPLDSRAGATGTARPTSGDTSAESARRGRLRPALVLGLIALAGLGIATYLTWTKLSGAVPVCGGLGGCEVIEQSTYSTFLGIPTGAYGLAYSLATLLGTIGWWRTGDSRLLVGLYALGLPAMVVVVYLRYLELFVIGAVCPWCVAYAATVVAGWLGAILLYRRRERAPG